MRLFATYERRRLETFLAMCTAGFGVWLLFPSEAMSSPALVHARNIASEFWWACMFLTNGVAHWLWLAVNGARWWSPIVRFGAAFGSSSLYLIWAVSIAAHDPFSTGVFTYGALSVGAAFCCVFAWRDAVSALRMHRAIADHL